MDVVPCNLGKGPLVFHHVERGEAVIALGGERQVGFLFIAALYLLPFFTCHLSLSASFFYLLPTLENLNFDEPQAHSLLVYCMAACLCSRVKMRLSNAEFEAFLKSQNATLSW